MLVVVVGGASSGKSALAEAYVVRLGGSRVYIATMQPYGEEGQRRVAKHRKQRAGLGFDTVECYTTLETLRLPQPYGTGLLECVGNLAANLLFGQGVPAQKAADCIIQGVEALYTQVGHLVVVTNNVFGDCQEYSPETQGYLMALGRANSMLADKADAVVEAVCGLPVKVKGELLTE